MINAKKAAYKTTEVNNKHKKRICKRIKHQIFIWNLLTKIAIAKGESQAQITYRARFVDSIFMEEAKLHLESLGYIANYSLHWFDTKYTLRWGWQQ